MKSEFEKGCPMKVYFFVLICLVSIAPAVEIDADDPLINYYGRIDFSNPKAPEYDWPGTVIESQFTGNSLAIKFSGDETRYNVIVDGGEPVTVIANGTNSYPVASGLSAGTHTVRIEKRHETNWYSSFFEGFVVDDSAKLLPLAKPSQKIEFIGDSYSVGYGVESPSRDGGDPEYMLYTNITKSYTVVTANHYGAQFQVNAISGKGLIRNLANSEPGMSVSYLHDYTLQSKIHENTPLKQWDFTQYIPDLVVINLGGNDFNNSDGQVAVDSSAFVTAYHDFLTNLRGHYPNTKFVLMASYKWPDNKVIPTVKTIIAEEKASGNSDVYYYEFKGPSSGWTGLHWHPSVSEQQGIADGLIKLIDQEKLLTVQTPIASIHELRLNSPLQVIGNAISISLNQPESGVSVICHSVSGREIARLYDGSLSAGSHRITLNDLTPGTYLVTMKIGGSMVSTVKTVVR